MAAALEAGGGCLHHWAECGTSRHSWPGLILQGELAKCSPRNPATLHPPPFGAVISPGSNVCYSSLESQAQLWQLTEGLRPSPSSCLGLVFSYPLSPAPCPAGKLGNKVMYGGRIGECITKTKASKQAKNPGSYVAQVGLKL